MLGDTDNNGKHTINDAVCIINHILNQPCPVFIEAAADLDGNGKITINDAVLLISQYILGTQSKSRMATRAASASDGANFLSIEDITMLPGEVKTIEVMMENDRNDIKGIQCDITLPQGVSFLYDEDSEDYVSATSRIPSKLALSSQMQDENNTLRVAGVCTGSASIYGNSGSVFTFMLKADENIKEGMYDIKLTNVELSYGEAIDVADHSSVLEIQNQASNVSSLPFEGKEYTETYDLNGRHIGISQAKNGIYIINGKKVYVK
ncbi:MAG: dockerin type I repeat-containing protein [Bacteroidaceae bacterium]|nr:dockerin type I repeat-containing protein [Bacteroidaceae bacterium]